MSYKHLPTLAALLAALLVPNPVCSSNIAAYLPGPAAQQQVRKLTGQINWHTNLGEAERQAQRQDKMIVWVQMLGRIDGAT